MASNARDKLTRQLLDFDELIEARNQICPTGAGRPAQRRGAAVIRGALVLLSAAFEAFVEELFDSTVDILFATATDDERRQLKSNTSGRLNNANVFRVNMLFFNLGIPWIMAHASVAWHKVANDEARSVLNELIDSRNQIAHGGQPAVHKPQAIRYREFVERIADCLDNIVAGVVETRTGTRPW